MSIEGIINLKDPSQFIEELKKGPTCNLQKIFDDAIDSINVSNEEIEKLNQLEPWYLKWANRIVIILTCGYLHLLPKTFSLGPVESNIANIKTAIKGIPEQEQTWREDFPSIKQRFNAAKTLQTRWRCRLRNKLKAENRTYEAWRTAAIINSGKAVYARALTIKNIYRPSHYTFTHGQSAYNFVITSTINCLTNTFKPNLQHPLNIHFRIPSTIAHYENFGDFLAQHYNTINDTHLGEDLLSVDASFNSTLLLESARSFYEVNLNCSYLVPAKPLLALLADRTIVNRFILKIETIASQNTYKHMHGTFYTILVPKKVQERDGLAYACLPYGIPREEQSNAMLQQIQNDEENVYSQYRILTSKLSQTPGVRVHALNNLSKQDNDAIQQSVRNEVIVFHAYATLFNLRSTITPPQRDEVLKALNDHSSLVDKDTLKEIIKRNRPFLPETFIQKLRELL